MLIARVNSFAIIFSVLLVLFQSCSSEKSGEKDGGRQKVDYFDISFNEKVQKSTKLNLTVFLDISRRIDTTEAGKGFTKYRDLQLIKSLAGIWKAHVLRKPMRLYNDQLNVMVHPVPSNNKLRGFFSELRFDMNQIKEEYKGKELKKYFNDFEGLVKKKTERVYNTVLTNHFEKGEEFTGSDIWGFFNNDVKELCIKKDYYNVLVVVTDGYIYYQNSSKPNSKGKTNYYAIHEGLFNSNFGHLTMSELKEKKYNLIPAEDNLNNLEVIFAEINPHQSSKHLPKIKYFINGWLDSMNVRNSAVYQTDEPSKTRQKLINYFSE